MLLLKISCVLCVVSLAVCQTYTRYDNLDVDQILSNQRVLTSYIKCFLDEGPCTPEGRQLKKDVPNALATQCAKCSEFHKKAIRKTATHLMKNRPEDWAKIAKKFDPDQKHKATFMEFLQGN